MSPKSTSSSKKFGAGVALLCFMAGAALFSNRNIDQSSAALNRALASADDCECKPSDKYDWSYNYNCNMEEHGQVAPDMWGAVYEECDGVRQSPINIARDIISTDCTAAPVTGKFQFFPGMCTYDEIGIVTDGKGWTVNFGDNCSVAPYVEINGKAFYLLQFHLHSMSEHVIGGGYYDAELHMVHVDAEDPNNLAVIGVMLTATSDNIGNEELAKYWDTLAYESGKQAYEYEDGMRRERNLATMSPAMTPVSEQVYPYSMLPADGTYYNYLGSLTTPPCNEIVTWIVMQQGVTISPDQLEAFRKGLTDMTYPLADSYGNNFRPPQPLNGRTVYQCKME